MSVPGSPFGRFDGDQAGGRPGWCAKIGGSGLGRAHGRTGRMTRTDRVAPKKKALVRRQGAPPEHQAPGPEPSDAEQACARP